MVLAALNDTTYNIILFLHMLTAFAAFSAMFVNLISGQIVRNSGRIYGYALVLSGLLGFALAGTSEKGFAPSPRRVPTLTSRRRKSCESPAWLWPCCSSSNSKSG